MFTKFARLLTHDIGIDLGTANTVVYVRGKGIVINEPSVVALNRRNNQVLAIGEQAKKMIGKTPDSIIAARPLVDGVVSDFEVTEQMMRYFLQKVHNEYYAFWPHPRIVVGIPSGVTEVEKRAVENAAESAGARKIYLVEEPVAAAIGARLPVQEATGSMIVDIGGGTTEVAVISYGGIVVSRSLRIAGDELSESIMQYLKDEHNLQIGEHTAEVIKINIGSAHTLKEPKTMPVRGRDILSGLPKEISLSSDQIRIALHKNVRRIVEAIKLTLEETPPELASDIMEHGIVMTGGGSKLRQLDVLLGKETGMPVQVADDPQLCVVQGTGLILEDIGALEEVLVGDLSKVKAGAQHL